MTTCTILLAPSSFMADFACNPNAARLARPLYEAHAYDAVCNISTSMTGEDAAEAMFDLTNNPDRQDERVRVYGRGRSVSTGDIVIVDGDAYLCASFGWEKL